MDNYVSELFSDRVDDVTPSDAVFTFRLRASERAELEKQFGELPGLKSHHLIARKVVRDFITGNLVYLSAKARQATFNDSREPTA